MPLAMPLSEVPSRGRVEACGSVAGCVCTCVHMRGKDNAGDADQDKPDGVTREVVKILGDESRTGAVVKMSRGSQWDGGNENTAYPGHVGVEKEGARTPETRRPSADRRTWTLVESMQSAAHVQIRMKWPGSRLWTCPQLIYR